MKKNTSIERDRNFCLKLIYKEKLKKPLSKEWSASIRVGRGYLKSSSAMTPAVSRAV